MVLHFNLKCSTQGNGAGVVQGGDAANLLGLVLMAEVAATASLLHCRFIVNTSERRREEYRQPLVLAATLDELDLDHVI